MFRSICKRATANVRGCRATGGTGRGAQATDTKGWKRSTRLGSDQNGCSGTSELRPGSGTFLARHQCRTSLQRGLLQQGSMGMCGGARGACRKRGNTTTKHRKARTLRGALCTEKGWGKEECSLWKVGESFEAILRAESRNWGGTVR